MKFQQGVYSKERIEALRAELDRCVPAECGAWLARILPRMKHHYKDDRSAFVSLRRYLVSGQIPGFTYVWNGWIERSPT